jgi:hypothetical protein
MTIFYRGPCVRITHKVFQTRCPTYRSFLLANLRRVQVVERSADSAAAIRSAGVGSAGVAGALAVIAGFGHAAGVEAFDSPVAMLGMVLLFIVSAAVSGACLATHQAEHELVAVYHGQRVTLYKSTNLQEFGQIRRALARALQQLNDAR